MCFEYIYLPVSWLTAAANGVEQAAADLVQSVYRVARSADRKGGWSLLVDSCKIIAGKTILLLQIVYGADIQRVFACADFAFDALNKLDPLTAR